MKLAWLIFSSLLFLIPSAIAVKVSDSISITVQVSELTMVDINPTSLSWNGTKAVAPGGEGVEQAIQIENIGSTNITYIWFNNTYPASNPFGTGINTSYNAGNFIVIRRNQTGEKFFFPNRVEYNMSKVEIYLTLPSGWISHGRFRNSSYEYFWVVEPGSGNLCNQSDAVFRIGEEPHTQTQTGSTDLTTCDVGCVSGPNPCKQFTLTGSQNYGYADICIGGDNPANTVNYTVVVNKTCDVLWFCHWNTDTPCPDPSTVEHTEYFIQTDLVPGDWIVANVRVRVPFGVAYGTVQEGTLTVIAQSQSSS